MDKDKMDKPNEPIFHDMKDTKSSPYLSPKVLVIFVFVILAGVVVGYLLSRVGGPVGTSSSSKTSTSQATKGTVFGSNDTSTFKDTAEGTLQSGGIDGEGQYHLVRPGGDSQNVYMTSSLVDLSQFVGKKIKVWGQTQAAQHAGWLMDVGRVEVE